MTPMVVLVATRPEAAGAWAAALAAIDPTLELRIAPDAGDPSKIEAVVMWGSHALVDLHRYPNLRLVVSMGAGVDHLFRPPGVPAGVPVARLVDVRLTQGMTEWVVLNVLRFHRQDPEYRAAQAARRWQELPPPDTAVRRIGILGLGALGQASARALLGFGFPVAGWSRGPKAVMGVDCFAGADGLAAMLARTDILVCLLPLTPDTRGIIGAATLAALPRGAFVINGGRGGHVDDAALLAALDTGQVAGAALDVFEPEPLPPGHRYWAHPGVVMTPHAASFTIPASAAPQVVDNLRRLRQGLPLLNLIEPDRGY